MSGLNVHFFRLPLLFIYELEHFQVGANFAETEVVVNGPPIFGNAKIQYSHLGNSATVTCELNSFPGIETVVSFEQKGNICIFLKYHFAICRYSEKYVCCDCGCMCKLY